ncbi:MAG: hypothetical protein LBN08_06900 [Lactobacillales bacterium]|nr:hypothetical protein [Lactobacillales bacterium]
MELRNKEAFARESALIRHCPELKEKFPVSRVVYITKFGTGKARNRKGVVATRSTKYYFTTTLPHLDEGRIVNLGMAFSEMCKYHNMDTIKAAYFILRKNGYSKKQILKNVGIKRLRKELWYLHVAPEGLESVAELDFYLKLRKTDVKQPKCNPKIMLSKCQAILCGTRSIRPDFYYPEEKVAIEFQSIEHHVGTVEGVFHDHAKMNSYIDMGITCFQVNVDYINKVGVFEAFIKMLKRQLTLNDRKV